MTSIRHTLVLGVCLTFQLSTELFAQFKTDNDSLTVIDNAFYQGTLFEDKKHGDWVFQNGKHPRITTSYVRDSLHGMSQHYYSNGALKCETEHTYGVPSGIWHSFHENGLLKSSITWNDHGTPLDFNLYYDSGNLSISKQFDYLDSTVMIYVESYYDNTGKFQKYTLTSPINQFKKNLSELGIELFVQVTPHWGINSSRMGELDGFYTRYYKNGRVWVHMELDKGRLLEVFNQNRRSGEATDGTFAQGNGSVIHFHHTDEIAAHINYQNGVKHGGVTYYYTGGNTFKTGEFSHGKPSGDWYTKSFSGKIRKRIEVIDDHNQFLSLYGPKNKLESRYGITDGLYNGTAVRFDFYGDTAAVFSYYGGLLNGEYKQYTKNVLLRSGSYHFGEQYGSWLTHGQFNPVSHATHFGYKKVIHDTRILPKVELYYDPLIEVSNISAADISFPYAMNSNVMLYTADHFNHELLETPDSDYIIGSTWVRIELEEIGLVKQINVIKSPSKRHVTEVKDLFSPEKELFIPQYIHGFPTSCFVYAMITHLN